MTDMEIGLYGDRRLRKLACMKLGSIAGAVGGVVSGIMGAGAATDAANAQKTAAQNGMNTLNTANQQVQQQYQPYSTTGTGALNMINSNLQNGTGFASTFKPEDYINSDAYNFNLQQGQNAVQGSAAARGGLLSGGTAKALQSFGSGLAANTYNTAYQQYLQSSQQNYNQLTGLAGLGLTATGQQANANLNTAQGVSGLQTQQGNSEAAGIIGRQNSINSAFGSVTGAADSFSLANSNRVNASGKSNPLSYFGFQL